jgi:hypothetical protein
MVNGIKEGVYIGLDNPSVTLVIIFLDTLNGHLHGTASPVGKTAILKFLFQYWFDAP